MKQNIIIGGYQGSASIHTKSIEYFINKISNNFVIDFIMDVTTNGDKASSLIEKTQHEEIHVSYLLSSYFEKILPEIKILDLPYLFNNRNEAYNFSNQNYRFGIAMNKAKKEIQDEINASKGIKTNILGTNRPDLTNADMKRVFERALQDTADRKGISVSQIPNLDLLKKSYGFEMGGVVSGPKTGYLAQLHGTEAIVPLPDGDSIPVEVQPGTSTTAPATAGMDNREQLEIMQTQVSRLDEMIRLMGRQISATDKVRTAVS